MSSPRTNMDPPVHLSAPLEGPEPAPGCGVCTALAKRRAEAAAAGDASRVTDCNVELRNHSHGALT